MKTTYSKQFEVKFKEVDMHMKLRMNTLVDYMQEVSEEHAQLLHLSDMASGQAIYWIIARAKMTMTQYPKWQEHIHIETEAAGVDGLFAMRKFTIYNSKEEQIGNIIGCYMMMDQHTHRPVRPKGLQGNFKVLEFPYEGEKLGKLNSPVEVTHTDRRRARYGDMDMNQHMNNAHYIRWATDMFHSEELSNQEIRSIQTNYTTSILEGTEVEIVRGTDGEGNIVIQGKSLDHGVTYWTSKIEMAK